MAKVAVIGAGIVGISAAVCIQENVPGTQVHIFAELQSTFTTSDGAAGIFHPDHVSVENQEDLKQWIRDSAEKYWSDCYSKSVETGIFEISGYSMSNSDLCLVQDPVLHSSLKNFRRLEGDELDKVPGGPWRYGSFKTTMITEPRILMAHLLKEFFKNGGKLVARKVESLKEFASDWDLVVNCAGLGARNLVGDQSMYPIRGQVLRVKAPWIKHFHFAEDDTYVIPNSELVVVGGTRQKRNWSLDISREDRDGIIERCSKMVPSITEAEIVREWVGLRPGRPTVRLELETLQLESDKSLPVIHNYGHGGDGIALSWGCGQHVARIANDFLQNKSVQPKCCT